MRACLAEKCGEADALAGEIQRVALDAHHLRLRLQALGISDASLIPEDLCSGGLPRNYSTWSSEHRRMIEWLAETCDMVGGSGFSVPGDVRVGEHSVTFNRMVQWPLSAPGGLKLSVPQDLETEIRQLLSRARKRLLDEAQLETLALEWEIVGAEVSCGDEPQPAIFLVHRESAQAAVVGVWPRFVEAPEATANLPFDPNRYFGARASALVLHCALTFLDTCGFVHTLSVEDGALHWCMGGSERRTVPDLSFGFGPSDRGYISGPFGLKAIADPSPGLQQREFVRQLLVVVMELGVGVKSMVPPAEMEQASAAPGISTGDPVLVEFEGQWFSGVLTCVEGALAHVQCDADPPEVITVAPLCSVRPAAPRRRGSSFCHRRCHTAA